MKRNKKTRIQILVFLFGGNEMQKRTRQITVRLTTQEKNHLDKQARLAGIKTEPFVRNLIAGSNIRERPAEYWGEMIRQLSAIGNNINQIAHIANATEYIDVDQLQETQRLMKEVWKIVKEV